jgi:nucleoside-diphosphate-sugar epimerase
MKSVLVTGFDGFIGSHLTEYLKGKYDLFGITRYAVNKKIQVNFPYEFVDITDFQQVKKVLKDIQPDYIINLAAESSVGRSFERPSQYADSNFKSVINLSENAIKEIPNLVKFIQASTPEVYGKQKSYPVLESNEAFPTTPYAVSKLAADKYLMYMHQAYNFPVTISRHANCYGRKAGIFSQLGVVENIITQMLKGNEVNLGDGFVRRDFVYIDDVTRWYQRLMEKGNVGEIYNLNGQNASIIGIAERCKSLLDWNGTIRYNTLPKRPGEMDNIEMNMEKAIKDMSFMREFDLGDGLIKTIDYWRKHI